MDTQEADESGEWYSEAQIETMTLRQIIEAASDAVDTYKNPDVNEAQRRINELLHAAKLGGTGSDDITSIRIGKDEVSVWTRYSVRSCDQTAEHCFPTFVLDAPDPVAAITTWAKGRRVAKAEADVKEAERLLGWRRKQLIEATDS